MNSNRKAVTGRALAGLIGAFLLAIVHQYLFYGNVPGISYPLFVILLYLYLFHDWKDRLREITGFAWFLFVVILLLSSTFALFDNPILRSLNLLIVPPLIFVHLAYIRGAKQIAWWDIRIVWEALDHLVPQSLRHIGTLFRIAKISAGRKMGSKQKSALGKVLIGLAIALPVLIVVVQLLASADGVFNRVLTGLPGWWNSLSLGESFARGIWIFVFGVLFFCYFWGFVRPKRAPRQKGKASMDEERSSQAAGFRIDPVILATLLISVNIVYVLFVAVQFSYLFGAWDGVVPDGKTYAEYARSGFVELVAVSVINFAILMATLVFEGGEAGQAAKKMNALLLYVLVACSGVMLYSAYMRLVLYEEAYGYTYIRFLVHAFMIFLAILLIIAALRIRTPMIPLTKIYIVIGLAAYVFVNYVGMDRIIAEKNIERFKTSGEIDFVYLGGLSADAVPTLAKFAEREFPDMKRYLENKRIAIADEDRAWPSFNLSIYRAEKVLNELQD
ncbi:DUF4153 domain-containing protein [Cohnella cholangitidis]|uniref:DUF4173 domain-containing protein n=1 Tax=Cohnella cholangitidis TaxID=2598458 RepID=A0A7G5BY77_9BACL|nr:DUF4173 domain-containing protein [Cohnella cholangitidis]QMV41911.1 DUF4173 domain-containing protein [Cohnella cholangitidis]